MSPRTGRPKAENPKIHSIKIRFDDKTNEALIDYCKKNNVTRTEAVRRGMDLLLSEKK